MKAGEMVQGSQLQPMAEIVDDLEIRFLHLILLGREPRNIDELNRLVAMSVDQATCCILNDLEFAENVYYPLLVSGRPKEGLYRSWPRGQLLHWLEKITKKHLSSDQPLTWRHCLYNYCDAVSANTGIDLKLLCKALMCTSDDMFVSWGGLACGRLTSTADLKFATASVKPCNLFSAQMFCTFEKVVFDYYDNCSVLLSSYVTATTEDPQAHSLTSIPVGHYALSLQISYLTDGPTNDYVQVFFDFGEGFSESESLFIPVRNNKVDTFGYLRLERPCKKVRLDPAASRRIFRIEAMTFQKL